MKLETIGKMLTGNGEKDKFGARLDADLREALSPDRVIRETQYLTEYARNETATERRVKTVVFPTSTEEIVEIVRIANRYKTPIYPVSTGKNWGYGGATPVTHDSIVIDLSRMNRIIEMDDELGVVTVEPGVTQQQLYDYLMEHNLRYLVPVTGAGPHCSLIGNALERGYGVTPHTDHFGAVMSLEAVLPNGNMYRSAHAEMGGSDIDKAFKWGVGPYLDGLFTQGNFGIVTRMAIALAPVPEGVGAFLISLETDEYLEKAVVAIRNILRKYGNIISGINLMNGHRMLAMFADYPHDQVNEDGVIPEEIVEAKLREAKMGPWTIGGALYGNRQTIKAARREIRRQFRKIAGHMFFFDRSKINRLETISRLIPGMAGMRIRRQVGDLNNMFKVAEGKPSEVALPLCYWKSGTRPVEGIQMNPAQNGCGLIWFSPLVVMKPNRVQEYVNLVTQICVAHSIEPLITLTSLSHRCFDSTVPILFDRSDPDAVERAKACYRALFTAGRERGFIPYRVGIDQMEMLVNDTSPFWKLVKKCGELIDPSGIISPGRYRTTDL